MKPTQTLNDLRTDLTDSGFCKLKRHLAIGDIHGCFDALQTLQDFVDFTLDDVLITLGDYVNRGPKSKAVIQWLIEADTKFDLKPLRGNHEIMMLSARDDELRFERFLRVGGDNTLRSYLSGSVSGQRSIGLDDIPQDHWDFLDSRLLEYYEIDDYFFVHANAYPDIPLNEQPEFMLYWEKFNDPPKHESGNTMICGHSSQRSGLPLFNENAICIDTKAHAGGWLSCLHVEARFIWQANEKGETRKFWLEEMPPTNL